jgi:flagellar basal body-associated protein FliL
MKKQIKEIKGPNKSEQTMRRNEQNKIKNKSNKCILLVVVVVFLLGFATVGKPAFVFFAFFT